MKNYVNLIRYSSASVIAAISIVLLSPTLSYAFTFHAPTHHTTVTDNCGRTHQDGKNDNNNNNCNINNNANNNSNSQSQNENQFQIQNNHQEQNFNPSIDNENNNNITIGSFAPPMPQVFAAPQIVSLPSTGSPLPETLMVLGFIPLGLIIKRFAKIG